MGGKNTGKKDALGKDAGRGDTGRMDAKVEDAGWRNDTGKKILGGRML